MFSILEFLFNVSSKTAKRIVVWFCVIVIITSSHFFPQQYKKASSAVVDYYVETKIEWAQTIADRFKEGLAKNTDKNQVR